jgi:hypothetical protein
MYRTVVMLSRQYPHNKITAHRFEYHLETKLPSYDDTPTGKNQRSSGLTTSFTVRTGTQWV